MTKLELYTDAMLTCDVPEHRLRRGDIVKLVEQHIAPDGTEGYLTVRSPSTLGVVPAQSRLTAHTI